MLDPFALEGAHVRLEPLTGEHVDGLAAAAAQDRRSYAFTWVPEGRDETARYVREALAEQDAGLALPWAVRRLADGAVVGSTRYMDMAVFDLPGIRHPDGRPSVLEIGSTWYAASAQRTPVNAEVKLLLLTHAFETWQVLRVTLKTDARNARSRTAIERLGAAFEGVRRAHTVAADGTVRDSAYYSITAPEWPAVRAGLLGRLDPARA